MDDDYQILGIGIGASVAEIRRAYVSKAKATHPDATGLDSSHDFKAITEAYRRLKGRKSRALIRPRVPVRPRPLPKPLEYPDFKSIRPNAHPTLPVDVENFGAQCILGRQHLAALATRNIARTISVSGRNGKRVQRSFVIPKGTKHGDHLQYKGFALKACQRLWFDLKIVHEDKLTLLCHDDV